MVTSCHQTTLTKARGVGVGGVPEVQSPFSNPFKGKLSNYMLGWATQKENK